MPTATAHRLPPPDLPAVVGFQHFARFESVDIAANRARFYTLTWRPMLWGGGALVWSWGRLGSTGVIRVAEFPDRTSAQAQIERLVRRRLRRRYELVAWT